MDNIFDEIKRAQETLNDIMIAINRENANLEEQKNKVQAMGIYLQQLSAETKKSEDECIQTKQRASSVAVAYEEEKTRLSDDKKKLEKKIALLQQQVITEQDSLDSKKKAIEAELSKTKEEYNKQIIAMRVERDAIVAENAKVKEENFQIKLENESLKSQASAIQRDLDQKIIKENELKHLLSDIVSKQLAVSSLDADIENLTNKRLEAIDLRDKIIVENAQLEEKKETLRKEIRLQEGEKVQFIQQKLDIAKAKEQIDGREAYIKSKYEQAGLTY